jgi:hypothetical protein
VAFAGSNLIMGFLLPTPRAVRLFLKTLSPVRAM